MPFQKSKLQYLFYFFRTLISLRAFPWSMADNSLTDQGQKIVEGRICIKILFPAHSVNISEISKNCENLKLPPFLHFREKSFQLNDIKILERLVFVLISSIFFLTEMKFSLYRPRTKYCALFLTSVTKHNNNSYILRNHF